MSILDHNDATRTVDYTYDGFRRLKTAATQGSHWGLSWSYDRYGNRLSQVKTKGTAPTNTLTVDVLNLISSRTVKPLRRWRSYVRSRYTKTVLIELIPDHNLRPEERRYDLEYDLNDGVPVKLVIRGGTLKEN